MRLYRIARATYAMDLTGEGSRLYGGRWTPPGCPAIYASEHPALAAWENAVHFDIGGTVSPLDYRLIEIAIEDDAAGSIVTIPSVPHAPLDVGRNWLQPNSSNTLLLRVPSLVIPLSWNVIINPLHPSADRMKATDHGAFVYDSRLPF